MVKRLYFHGFIKTKSFFLKSPKLTLSHIFKHSLIIYRFLAISMQSCDWFMVTRFNISFTARIGELYLLVLWLICIHKEWRVFIPRCLFLIPSLAYSPRFTFYLVQFSRPISWVHKKLKTNFMNAIRSPVLYKCLSMTWDICIYNQLSQTVINLLMIYN